MQSEGINDSQIEEKKEQKEYQSETLEENGKEKGKGKLIKNISILLKYVNDRDIILLVTFTRKRVIMKVIRV